MGASLIAELIIFNFKSVFLAWSTTSVCKRDDFKAFWKPWMKRSTTFLPPSQNPPTYARRPRAASRNCERSVSGGCRKSSRPFMENSTSIAAVMESQTLDWTCEHIPASKNNFMTQDNGFALTERIIL